MASLCGNSLYVNQGKLACILIFLSLVELSSEGVMPVALGQNCMEQSSDMDECTASDDNSECDIGNTDKCICSAGYFEEFAVCKAVIGMSCTLTSQCTDLLVNTVCSSFQCACVRGSTGTSCSDFVSGMACSNDADCQDVLLNTVCTSLQCACAAGFSGLACSSVGAGKISKTTVIPLTTILLTVMYKCLI